MAIGSMGLTSAVKALALPESAVRAVVADYLDFLSSKRPQAHAKLDARLQEEPDLFDLFYFEAQASMLGAALILTMEEKVPVGALLVDVYGSQPDADLLDMRKELVSRALHQTKDAMALTGLSPELLAVRKKEFCQA